MLIEQPIRGKGVPYWSNLHESLAACIESVLGPMRQPEEKKYLERCVRDFLTTQPGQWLAEAVHGEIPAPQAQEEPSGAPAPACDHDWRHCITDVAEYDLCLKCWGIGDPTTGRILMVVPENQRRPQPPAPAGDRCPACGFPWTRKPGQACPTADCNYVEPPAPASPAGLAEVLAYYDCDEEARRNHPLLRAYYLENPRISFSEWMVRRAAAPAAPEAGAPGTQGACLWTEVADGDGYFESSCGVSMAFQEGGGPKDDADYIHCQKCGKKIELDEPPTQTQEGGSQQ